jgi:uncharacterized membrane protein
VSNSDQTDSDLDGLGNPCDATPSHDLAVVGLTSGNAAIQKRTVLSATITAKVTVQNLRNWPEPYYLNVWLENLPPGCQITKAEGNNVSGTLSRNAKTTVTVKFTITAAASTPVGTYPLNVQAQVNYNGSGYEENMSNNTKATMATLTIRYSSIHAAPRHLTVSGRV